MLYDFFYVKPVLTQGSLDCHECFFEGFCRGECSLPSGVHYEKMKIMLQNEFEERIGRSVTKDEYIEANAVYELAGDMDKDTFCREWKNIGKNPLLIELFSTACRLEKEVCEYKLGSKVSYGEIERYKVLFGQLTDQLCDVSKTLHDILRMLTVTSNIFR